MLKKELEDSIKKLKAEVKKLTSDNEFLKDQIIFLQSQLSEKTSVISSYKTYQEKFSKDTVSIIKQNVELKKQVLYDMQKFNELYAFLQNAFPTVLKSATTPPNSAVSTEGGQSNSIMGEDGKIYIPMHVVDSSINIIKKLLNDIDDLKGNKFDDFDNYEGEDD